MKKQRHVLPVIAIVLLTTIAFLPALGGDFVTWDDNRNFTGNEHYRGLGLTQLKWMWSTTLMGHYIPVSWMTLGLDYVVWEMDGRGYHLTNLALHCLAAVLLYFVALRLFRAGLPAGDADRARLPVAAAVLVFAVHPLRVESVAWITERRDMLSLVFFLVTLHFYVRAIDRPTTDRRLYVLSLASFCLAVLSKATVVTLPIVLAVINVVPLRRLDLVRWKSAEARQVYRELVPFFAISVAAGMLSLMVLKPPAQLGLADKIAVTAYSLRFYVEKIFFPAGLSPLYEMPREIDPLASRFVVSYVVIIAALAVLWRYRHRAPAATAVIVAAGAIMLPFLGIVQNGPQIAADRYTYHAAAALSLLAALALVRWPGRGLMAGAIAIILALGAVTWRQSTYWVDSERLWSRVLEVDSTSSVAQFAMADLRLAQGSPTLAKEHFARGVTLDSLYPEGHNNLGSLLMQEGRVADALEHFRRAVALRPGYPEAHLNLGAALSSSGSPQQALDEFRIALSLRPDLPNAHLSRGNALVRLGRLRDALAEYEAELELYPGNEPARAYRDEIARMLSEPPQQPSRAGGRRDRK